jgi:hypothetical protein
MHIKSKEIKRCFEASCICKWRIGRKRMVSVLLNS